MMSPDQRTMSARPLAHRSIWVKEERQTVVQIIDQRFLPHRFVVEDLKSVRDVASAIREMHLRGAPLIGVAAAFGMYFAARQARPKSWNEDVERSGEKLRQTRPTAVNLAWAVDKQLRATHKVQEVEKKIVTAFRTACQILDGEINVCKKIGEHGFKLIEAISRKKRGEPVNVLTHCNAGWLACVEWGTATSPIYQAFDKGIKLHVWVDETRPRSQGASLTAWEMAERKIPHTVIVDGASGHLMQKGLVDLVMVGTDRTTRGGDAANKIGTYMVALAAKDNKVPFYVALPSSSIDWEMDDGLKQIPIEERNPDEVTHVQGFCDGEIKKVRLIPEGSKALNYAFDVTPRHLITGLITERGISPASEEGLLQLFSPEDVNKHQIPFRSTASHDSDDF